MPSVNCGLVNPNYPDLLKGIKKWANSSKAKKLYVDPYEAAFRLAENDFLIPLDTLQNADSLTKGQVKSFIGRLRQYTDKVESGKLDNEFFKYFWQSSHYGKKDPSIGQFLNNAQQSGFKFRTNEVRDKTLVRKIMKALEKEAIMSGLTSKFGIKQAKIKLTKLDNDLLKALADVKNGEKGAEKRFRDIKSKINFHIKGSGLRTFDEAINIIERQIPKALSSVYAEMKAKAYDKKGNVINKNIAKELESYDDGSRVLKLTASDLARFVKMEDGRPLSHSNNMYEAISSYMELMNGLHKTLRLGINSRIDSVIKRLKINGDDRSAGELVELRKKLEGMYMPKYEQGFYPHYVRDLNVEFLDGLMKPFDEMQRAVNPYDMKSKSIKDIINGLNLHISEHTQRRQQEQQAEGREFVYDYSRNFFNSIENYVFDVNRFNFTAFMDSHLINALGSIEKIYKKEGSSKGYAKNVADFIIDMHKAANGDSKIDPTSAAVMRTFLSFEFISKLGLNPRGAARNAFQRLLDYVEWGPVMIRNSKRYLQEIAMKEGDIDNILANAGLLFQEATPQLMESQLSIAASKSKRVRFNEKTMKHEAYTKGTMEKVADGMGVVASKSSWLHRKAENSNRRHTFKIAYAQMHKWLNNPQYKSKLAEEGKSEKSQESIINRKAENYAINMVLLNHFDYADYSKSKLMRSKIGRFAFQFQHFSMEFAERNLRILREAKYDIASSQFNPKLLSSEPGGAQGIAKAIRMAMLYFGAPAIAAMLWGVDFSNLIEHDTVERVNQLASWATGDEEEQKAAFYGKGPVLATLGGPLLSDILNLGLLLELQNADGEDYVTLFTGLERHDPSNSSTDLTRKIRLLNTFAGRFTERHIPNLRNGKLGWALNQEFGVYPTAEARKKQKKLDKIRKKVLPSDIEKALQQLERR